MADSIPGIDMSSCALDLRLRQLSGLHKLGMSLQKAKSVAAYSSQGRAELDLESEKDRNSRSRNS